MEPDIVFGVEFCDLDLCMLPDDVDMQTVPLSERPALDAVSAIVALLPLGRSPSPTPTPIVTGACGSGLGVRFGTEGEDVFFFACTWTGAFFFTIDSSFCPPSPWGSDEEDEEVVVV